MEIMLVKMCPHCGGYRFIKEDDFKFKCTTCEELVYTPEMKLVRLNVSEEDE